MPELQFGKKSIRTYTNRDGRPCSMPKQHTPVHDPSVADVLTQNCCCKGANTSVAVCSDPRPVRSALTICAGDSTYGDCPGKAGCEQICDDVGHAFRRKTPGWQRCCQTSGEHPATRNGSPDVIYFEVFPIAFQGGYESLPTHTCSPVTGSGATYP